MRYLLITLITALSLQLSAQNFIDKHFGELEDIDRSTVVHVTSKSFNIAAQIMPEDDDEAAEIKEFIASIKAVDVVTVPEWESTKSDYKKAISILDRGYEELMSFKDADSRFSLHIDAKDNIVYEVIGVGYDEHQEFVLISITGEMDLDLISKAIESIPMDDIPAVRNFKNTDSAEYAVYPNPVASGTDINIDIPDRFLEGRAYIHDMSGATKATFKIKDVHETYDTTPLSPGTYSMIVERDGLSLQKKFIVLK